MDLLTHFMPLFTAIIAFCSFFGALGLVFKMLLSPVKKDIEIMQKDIDGLKSDIKGNKVFIKWPSSQ